MKKIYILLIFALVFCFYPHKTSFESLSNRFDAGEYCFYVKGEERGEEFLRAAHNGNETLLYCPLYEAGTKREQIRNEIRGESFRIEGGAVEAQSIIDSLNAKVVSEGVVSGVYCIYLYSGRLDTRSVNLFGERVNLQLAISGDTLTAGFPLILGGY